MVPTDPEHALLTTDAMVCSSGFTGRSYIVTEGTGASLPGVGPPCPNILLTGFAPFVSPSLSFGLLICFFQQLKQFIVCHSLVLLAQPRVFTVSVRHCSSSLQNNL